MARPRKVARALLDASALIGYIKGEPEFECLKSLFAAVDRGDVVLVESTAILAEVQPGHVRDTEAHALARDSVRELLMSPDTELLDVSTTVGRKAGNLRTEFGLTTWDAVHLATAIIARVDILVVRDGKFPKGMVEGVWVTGPYDIDDDKLFS